MSITLWPHQQRIDLANRDLYRRGVKWWCNVAPCGSGKTIVMVEFIKGAIAKGKTVAVYSCRKQNTQQIINVLKSHGIAVGVIASDLPQLADSTASVQVCQLQTVAARLGSAYHPFPFTNFVLVDEAHQQVGDQAKAVFDKHSSYTDFIAGIGTTATPVNLSPTYEEISDVVTYKELLQCKAHLPVKCFGPDRPDLTKLRTNSSGDFSYKDDVKHNNPKSVFGRILPNYYKLNPDRKPSIAFMPGVKESIATQQMFMKEGISSAHIDGERIILCKPNTSGVLECNEYRSTQDVRDEALGGSEDGTYEILLNRFVLREAVDCPWLYHCLIATSFGSISSYLQSAGRILRYHPSLDHVVIQDHGANIDRHGLPNEPREWELGDTNKTVQQKIKKRRERTKGADAEPICCPKCNAMRTHGPQCPNCGHMHKRSSRMIREIDGTLVRKSGRTVKYKQPKSFDDYMRSQIYAGYHKGHSVRTAYQIARERARKDKHLNRNAKSSIRLPPDGSSAWDQSVREVYRGFRPRGAKGK